MIPFKLLILNHHHFVNYNKLAEYQIAISDNSSNLSIRVSKANFDNDLKIKFIVFI